MKTKIINTKKPDITDNDILQSKPSFNSLYSKFASFAGKAFISKGLLYWASFALVVVATAIFVYVKSAKDNNDVSKITPNKNDTTKHEAFVEPPLKSVVLEYKQYNVDANKRSEITTCRGTKISIPEKAFVYKDGSPVEGDVMIKYREFNNPVEIFQSGIPMNYDSANTKHVFESAGMIELTANKNGDPVFLAKDKSIDVALKSDNKEDRFNVYYLDTNKRQWEYEGRDALKQNTAQAKTNNVSTMPNCSKGDEPKKLATEVISNNNIELVSNKNNDIIKPVLATKNASLFKVDFNTKDFPELSAYKNLLFEVEENSSKFNKDLFTINWDKITLKHSNVKNLYLVTLQKRDSTVNIMASPVFNKKQYDEAMKIFTEKEKSLQKERPQATENQISASTLATSYVSGLGDNNSTTRSFKIYELGYWNCDQPLPFSNFTTVAAVFKDAGSGASLNCKAVYVATLKANILLKWTSSQIGYSKVYDNVCFVVTYDEKIGIVDPTKFKSALLGNSVFMANIYSPIDGIKELNKWIGKSL